MKKIREVFRSPLFSIGAFLIAAALLVFAAISGTRATLTYFSETYASRVRMYDIGVSLLENGERVSWRDYNNEWVSDTDASADGTWNVTGNRNTDGNDVMGVLLSRMVPEGEKFVVGKTYPEVLSVRNSYTGKQEEAINEYVRVTVYKYWINPDGEKAQELDPAWIDLNLVNLGSDWILDESSSTPERTVLYYNKLLLAGAETAPFSDTLTIADRVATKVTQEVSEETDENGQVWKKIKTTYDYDGYQFMLEASVDAVQEHNAEDAILSAWGRRVKISNKTLSLMD